MEEEFIRNQERLKPQEEKIEEERSKVLLKSQSIFVVNKCIYMYGVVSYKSVS